MGNGYVKKLKKWLSKVTLSRDFWPKKYKYSGGNIKRLNAKNLVRKKFEFVTEVTVPFFRPPVAPHARIRIKIWSK